MERRVLLVEDDASTGQILSTIIEHLGYTCGHAWDGHAGVQMALSFRPDVIVMDLLMPVLDGVEAIRQLKALRFIAHIPIILATSALGDPRIADATAAGAAAVLIKPVGRTQLDNILRLQLANLGRFLIDRGLGSHRRGDLENALANYDEAIRINPAEPMAYNNRGSARRDRQDFDGAMADFSEAIRLKPDYAMALNNRGVVRAAQGDLDGAIADYTEALRLEPNDAAAFNNRGTARRYRGDTGGALADYAEALRARSNICRPAKQS